MKISRIGLGVTALATAGLLVLSGCASGDTDKPDASGNGVVTANGTEPQNPLIPTSTNEVGGGRIIDSLFAGLVYYDAKGEYHNEVAQSFEPNADFTEWNIELNNDWKFSDGTPVTANSFVDAWSYGASLKNAQLNRYFFNMIEGYQEEAQSDLTGLTVQDDTHFTVKLNSGDPEFPLRLGYSAYYPLPESAFDDMKAFGQNPIGNGPYKLASDDAWEHDVQIKLLPNENYDGGRKAANGGLTFVFYSGLDSAYADLLSGNLDVLDEIPENSLEVYRDELGDRAVTQPAARNQTFTIPERLDHFAGEEGTLRRAAISMAIDRDKIGEVVFKGARSTMVDFTSPVIAGFNDNLKGKDVLEYNPTKAKELWAEADKISPWSGTFTIGYNSDSNHQSWVDAVSNGIKDNLGINAEGKPYATFAEFRAAVTDRTTTGAARAGWQADYPSQYNFLGPVFGTGAGSNDGDYSNPEFDKLIAEGSQQTDETKKYADFSAAQEILLEDLPVIPLWYQNATGGFSESVDNVVFGWEMVPLYYQVTKK
ncbi:ABC transporter substrate-binding protein [Klugiella xanthotipulae]|uniref:Oligopeptide transport system substrate-binding protein n=1 Tax=Klugiella xanthotipulae TaxID=244735 RepID=A0A543HXI6_9MICO|nr:ABC transporter substrate-binding protein [Klugiella xanthotipulae]TQM63046.1 oligopeptide transport system substrate-binding protein [Klugiella xanthotipulae]